MADEREALGRLVHETRVTAFREQIPEDPDPRLVAPWEELTDFDREAAMRIGHAVANYALTENAATWGTSCTSCARILDSAYAETVRREAAEVKLAAVRAKAEAMTAAFPEDLAGDWLRGRQKAGRAILAIISGEEKPQADAVPPPSLAAIRAYLGVRGWNEEEPTLAGVLWNLHGAVKVAVPLEDGHPDLMRAIVARVARAEGRTQGETAAAIHAAWTARNERPETGSEEETSG